MRGRQRDFQVLPDGLRPTTRAAPGQVRHIRSVRTDSRQRRRRSWLLSPATTSPIRISKRVFRIRWVARRSPIRVRSPASHRDGHLHRRRPFQVLGSATVHRIRTPSAALQLRLTRRCASVQSARPAAIPRDGPRCPRDSQANPAAPRPANCTQASRHKMRSAPMFPPIWEARV